MEIRTSDTFELQKSFVEALKNAKPRAEYSIPVHSFPRDGEYLTRFTYREKDYSMCLFCEEKELQDRILDIMAEDFHTYPNVLLAALAPKEAK